MAFKPLPPVIYTAGEDIEGNSNGPGYLIATTNPPFVGKILFFDSYVHLQEELNSGKFFAFAVVPGYNIAIVYHSILAKGRVLSVHPSVDQQVTDAMAEFADYYLKSRCLRFASRFKRYKLFKDDRHTI